MGVKAAPAFDAIDPDLGGTEEDAAVGWSTRGFGPAWCLLGGRMLYGEGMGGVALLILKFPYSGTSGEGEGEERGGGREEVRRKIAGEKLGKEMGKRD